MPVSRRSRSASRWRSGWSGCECIPYSRMTRGHMPRRLKAHRAARRRDGDGADVDAVDGLVAFVRDDEDDGVAGRHERAALALEDARVARPVGRGEVDAFHRGRTHRREASRPAPNVS